MKSLSKIQYTKLVQISLTQSSYLQLVSETSQLDVHQDFLTEYVNKEEASGYAGENEAFQEMGGRKG